MKQLTQIKSLFTSLVADIRPDLSGRISIYYDVCIQIWWCGAGDLLSDFSPFPQQTISGPASKSLGCCGCTKMFTTFKNDFKLFFRVQFSCSDTVSRKVFPSGILRTGDWRQWLRFVVRDKIAKLFYELLLPHTNWQIYKTNDVSYINIPIW